MTDPRPYNPDGRPFFHRFDPASVPSPCFVVDRGAVEHNLSMLRNVADEAGAVMLLALKAFALPALFDLVGRYLDGVCASGIYEARLGREEVAPHGGDTFQVHTYAPAYTADELTELLDLSDHISFNSVDQYRRLGAHDGSIDADGSHGKRRTVCGFRVNPEFSTGGTAIYDPCAPYSRLGITATELKRQLAAAGETLPERDVDPWPRSLEGISALHMHTLCEEDSYALERTVTALEDRFGALLRRREIRYLNLGGGHHITKPNYDRSHLVDLIRRLRERYNIQVILEPGEAAVIHTGILVASVVDITHNGMDVAILDTSATAHMPDTLEMPYRPDVWGASLPGNAPHLYRLGGQTCLAGDVIGDYAFHEPLSVGDRLIFDDMSHYTMVKTTTFNGIPLPAIATWDGITAEVRIHRRGSYDDFRSRLGA